MSDTEYQPYDPDRKIRFVPTPMPVHPGPSGDDDRVKQLAAAVLAETNRLYPRSMTDQFPTTERLLQYMRDVRVLCEAIQGEA